MTYRAILSTLVSVCIALLAAWMWVRAVTPMVAVASSQPGWNATLTPPPDWKRPAEEYHPPPERELKVLIKGTLLLSFVLIGLLVLVGFAFSSVRAWVRHRTTEKPVKRGKRTPYVDAWKLAGERLKPDDPPEDASETEEGR